MNARPIHCGLAALAAAAAASALASCRSTSAPPLELAESVDLERFMGTWRVHGHTPTFLDREAYQATETYELQASGRIATTYRFRKGGFDGPVKVMRPVGRVEDHPSNAVWSMRFFGFLRQPYLILHVDEDYAETVVGQPNRSRAWIMTRSPEIAERRYQRLRGELERRGFDLEDFRRLPQRPPTAE